MKHIESSLVPVYFSREYSNFKFLPGNRPINMAKCKKIIKEIDNGNDMLMYYPIQVQKKDGILWILDGQHRFYVSKFFQKNIFYIIVKESKSMAQIAKVNSNVEKWKMDNYLNCYIDTGNEHYKKIKTFLDAYNFGYSISLKLLQSGNPGFEGFYAGINEAFKNGEFEVKFYDDAVLLADKIQLFDSYPFSRGKGFIIAIYRIWKAGKISIEDLKAQCDRFPDMLTRQSGYKNYVVNFEAIINKNKQKRIFII